jgi:hypothetical protein
MELSPGEDINAGATAGLLNELSLTVRAEAQV